MNSNRNLVSLITSEETPPGLQVLADLNSIAVTQELELIEVVTGFETENKYDILNPEKNQQILFAREDTSDWNRMRWGSMRAFDMSVYNIRNEEILHMKRFLRCTGCCCFCCLQKMEIYAPPGNLLGTIEQLWAFCKPKLVVNDSQGNALFKIKGPFCVWGTVDFVVTSAKNGAEIGIIEKKWRGYAAENYTDADIFGMDFKQDPSVEVTIMIIDILNLKLLLLQCSTRRRVCYLVLSF